MLKKIGNGIYAWSFQKRMVMILVLFSIIPSVVIAQIMAHQYETYIISNTSTNMHAVVAANNSVLEMKFKQIEDVSLRMLNNEEYYQTFAGLSDQSVSSYMGKDRELSSALAREFSTEKDVYESFLYVSGWFLGKKQEMSTSPKGIEESGFLEIAENAGGQPSWIAGYDYGEQMGSVYLQGKDSYSYQYPITMVRKMQFQYNDSSDYRRLNKAEDVPTLFVFVLEEDVRAVYENSLGYEGSIYGISNQDGAVISSDSQQFPVTQKIPESIGNYYGKSGFATCSLGEQQYLLCYDMLEDMGWFSWALVPLEKAIQETVNQIRSLQMLSLLACLAVSAVVAWLLSKSITRPVGTLIRAAKRVSTGVFSADTPVPREKDFKMLTESFNHMEREINRLIHENYEISLREKETQLMALSMQINPHFLYNTLNTINMLAIQNDDEETSELIVCLSEMLQYTFRNTSEKILLVDEIGWLSDYLYIMSTRFENVFQSVIDIDEELMECKVPKFFLQPLVENAILHGFREMNTGGILKILGSREEECIHFQVQDNGKGMDQETIRKHITEAVNDSGIGISNVHRRMMLIYGEKYRVKVESEPGEGTLIHLYIPCEC